MPSSALNNDDLSIELDSKMRRRYHREKARLLLTNLCLSLHG